MRTDWLRDVNCRNLRCLQYRIELFTANRCRHITLIPRVLVDCFVSIILCIKIFFIDRLFLILVVMQFLILLFRLLLHIVVLLLLTDLFIQQVTLRSSAYIFSIILDELLVEYVVR
jgi:hypothetical protein